MASFWRPLTVGLAAGLALLLSERGRRLSGALLDGGASSVGANGVRFTPEQLPPGPGQSNGPASGKRPGSRTGVRQFGLRRSETASEGLARVALGQLDAAIELLEGAGRTIAPDRAIHDTRKALKRLRTVLRLVREDLGEVAFAPGGGRLRDAGLRLAGAREAEVMLATLDSLIARHPGKLKRTPARQPTARAAAIRARASGGGATGREPRA